MSTIDSYTDATRPLASANTGLCIFNTSSNAIEVSDGTNWLGYNSDGTTGNSLSLEFDGNDRLNTTYQSATGGDDFSVSFWMKTNGTGGTYQDIFRDDSSGSYGRLSLLTEPGSSTPFYLRYGTATGNNVDGTIAVGTIYDNQWHHIVVVLDNSGTYTNVKIYRDGATTPVYSADANTTNGWANNGKQSTNSQTNYVIGSTPTGTLYPYTGKLDQIAFFGSALTSSNVSDIYNSGNGAADIISLGLSPEAYYRIGYFSEDTNSDGSVASAGSDIGTVADYSGNNYDASQSTASQKPNYVADPAS